MSLKKSSQEEQCQKTLIKVLLPPSFQILIQTTQKQHQQNRLYSRLIPPKQATTTTAMSLFKSNKNKTSSAASTPAQTPRPSADGQRPSAQPTKMTRDQALELALSKTVQVMPAAFSLIPSRHIFF
ncbi:MAG: hypothetical protein J3R72DRAFT_524643 [Linnemannia gamsii]|nr:MAG: hypothetical protein J3R72DRAFT_524643 [Linnemannia gamsii]